ncbi:SEC-C motif-containing protein [Flavobacterium sp. PL11]|uniref:YchJ family protein n=1 Tax=Flavobacterium sp. PL11 TaxID=3071717 RepID=UPI002DFF6F97|nr:SEC-C motif-containing protein [Flavobacterium sp. PL11]
MIIIDCYCGSSKQFRDCCEPIIKGAYNATTAVTLMRSRYSAYATLHADYLQATTHISTRKFYSIDDILQWATSNHWQKLEVLHATENTVGFKAYYLDDNGQNQIHHELSSFVFENGSWFYVDGKFF